MELVHTPFPRQLIIETTAGCNQACIFCGRTYAQRPLKTMKPELVRKILEETARESPLTEIWPTFMGEATLLKNIFDYVRLGKDLGCKKITLNSNGSMLDEPMIEKIVWSGVDRLIISMDAATPETHAKVRPAVRQEKNDLFFWRMWNGTVKLLEVLGQRKLNKPIVEIQFSVFKENVHELEQFKEFWLARGGVVKIRPMLLWTGTIPQTRSSAYYAVTTQDAPVARGPCLWSFDTMGIHWNGSVVMCAVDSEGAYVAGSAAYQSLAEIWNKQLWYIRELHRQRRFNELPHPCRGCSDWQVKRSVALFSNTEKKTVYENYIRLGRNGETTMKAQEWWLTKPME